MIAKKNLKKSHIVSFGSFLAHLRNEGGFTGSLIHRIEYMLKSTA